MTRHQFNRDIVQPEIDRLVLVGSLISECESAVDDDSLRRYSSIRQRRTLNSLLDRMEVEPSFHDTLNSLCDSCGCEAKDGQVEPCQVCGRDVCCDCSSNHPDGGWWCIKCSESDDCKHEKQNAGEDF